jgi:hypothetical protein
MGSDSETADQHVVVGLTNSHELPFTFVLEPWGEVYEFPAGATFVVVAQGPAGDNLVIDNGERVITVWGWSGSNVEVFHNGKLISHSGGPPVPSVPAGMSIRGFLGMVMGNGEKPSDE